MAQSESGVLGHILNGILRAIGITILFVLKIILGILKALEAWLNEHLKK